MAARGGHGAAPSAGTVDTSPPAADEVRTTTCYMCAGRCGIRVHLQDGRIRHIDGNPDHPVNRGVLCAKGAAGIMQHASPARLQRPLMRTGPRGSGAFREVDWDTALGTAAGWLGRIRACDPRGLAFFTGRDQSQALTGYWASRFGTPNYAAHGGFCSVNMAAAGIYSIGGSFWEFGEPDWEHTRYFIMFGCAEDHDSNPLKRALGALRRRGDAKFVSVNPVRTGYSAIADEWLGIRPGADGLFIMALIHELIRTRRVDLDWLVRYTNAPWLVRSAPGAADDGLFARDRDGTPLAWDRRGGRLAGALLPNIAPALDGRFRLPDGGEAVPVFRLLLERFGDSRHAPAAVAGRVGIDAATIRRIAGELAEAAFAGEVAVEQPWTDWAGRRHERFVGRPVAMHAMRGISAHANGFQTCRALHVLQMLLGSIDSPGGFRYRPPFPRPAPPGPPPAGQPDELAPERPLAGMPLGFPAGPEDLLVTADGAPGRIDKAFSWDAPLAVHGMLHMVVRNAWAGDPYPIDTLFLFMANMSWNSAMDPAATMAMLTDTDPATGDYRIPRIIYSDAYFSEMVPYADLVLPDTTYLERWDCISLLDRPISSADGPADGIRRPVTAPDRDVRPFQDVLIDLGARLGLPGFVDGDGAPLYPGGYADYMVNHERAPGIGPLAGWRGADGGSHGRGEANPRQLDRYAENGCFWRDAFAPEQRYMKHANRAYLDHAHRLGWIAAADQIVLQLYCEPLQRFRLAARGHGGRRPPPDRRARIARFCDPLPFWYPPFEDGAAGDDYPLHAVTQRPMAMYHSWGSQNAWLRQIHGWNRLFVSRRRAAALGLADDDWVWIASRAGRVRAQIRTMDGCNDDTVWTWNAVGKRAGAWNLAPDAPEARRGFLLNHLISELRPPGDDVAGPGNCDPVTGQAAWFDLRVRLEKCAPGEAGETAPRFAPLPRPPGLEPPPAVLRHGAGFRAGGAGP